jgi:4-hydroxybenzoate polyprenyltransferase
MVAYSENPENWIFMLLVLGTVFIAAGANIINDVFDIEEDRRNKPLRQLFIGTLFSKAQGNTMYAVTTIAGLLCVAVVSFMIGKWYLFVIVLALTGLLYFYSLRYKRQPLIGNIVVSFASAMVLILVWLFEFFDLSKHLEVFSVLFPLLLHTMRMIGVYALFSFLSSMIREIIKDMQDYKGDAETSVRTMPVAWGFPISKTMVCVLLSVLLLLVVYWQYFLFTQESFVAAASLIVVDVLVIVIFVLTLVAQNKQQYGLASLLTKIMMLVGILSIVLIHSL